jgi:hypothetical protein
VNVFFILYVVVVEEQGEFCFLGVDSVSVPGYDTKVVFYLKAAKQFTIVSITATSLFMGSSVSWSVCARLRIWAIIC